ncbi:hypothetical protein GDO86_012382 [Hymenochirus boettgeri]|uniref:Trans-1,2-dihydrobenzene-1,2-diol dehydrogenase n=1 Tax=Hymenochirus boettgeri TaxID=247094 RepID=A0A8T2ISD8_9PIPI|nr:hypothetical protein GDO86_012382 [Hymenochirus boettgeri]
MATRWGICSAGKISNDFLVALDTLPIQEHQVMAIAARDMEKAKNFAETHNIPKAYGSYEDLAKDPDIDVVYVGALHIVHRDIVLIFLQNGKNVLCEKPMAVNAAQVRELVAAARKNNVFLMEAFWSRFFPAYEEIRDLLTQNAIGDVKFVRAEIGRALTHVPRMSVKELGGGATLNIGCYLVQFALMVFNGERPECVTAKGFLHETGVIETVSIILQYPNKWQATLSCSFIAGLTDQAVICGSKGIIQVPSRIWCPTSIIVNGTERTFPLPPSSKPHHYPNATGLSYEAEHVRQCLLKGLKESPIMSLADSEMVASIMDEVHKQFGIM